MLAYQRFTLTIMIERYSRQSFLGENSDEIFARLNVGIVGLGGGGSHIAQQLTHLGIKNFVLADDDHIEDTNLNRLIGGTSQDVLDGTSKVAILSRLIKGINPDSRISAQATKWQDTAKLLRDCDCIFGCVDSLNERHQLESFSRRFVIPYIDIGIDIFDTHKGFYITGQVARSIPSGPCLRCLNILNDQNIAQESLQYGSAGSKPQVVWSNGVVASSAVGMFVEIFTDWHGGTKVIACLDYDGNKNTVEISNRMKIPCVVDGECDHYPKESVGDPFFSNNHYPKHG